MDEYIPFLCCAKCGVITKDWKWIENPNDKEYYGVCNECVERFKFEGLGIFIPSDKGIVSR